MGLFMREIATTFSFEQCTKWQYILRDNGIKYSVRIPSNGIGSSNRGRDQMFVSFANTGTNSMYGVQYKIFVNKKDFDLAKHVLNVL